MKKFLVLLVLAPLLGGCFFDPVNNPIGITTQYDIEAGYFTAEQIALAYMALPLCKTGTSPSLSNQCGKRSVKLVIQTKGASAQAAVVVLRNFVKNNPTLNPITALQAAQTAVADFQFALSATQKVTQ